MRCPGRDFFTCSQAFNLLRQIFYPVAGLFLAALNPLWAQSDTSPVSEMVQVEGNERESELANLIQEAVQSESLGGAFYSYQGSLVSAISPGEVALLVLDKNLSLVNTRADRELAEQAKLEAQAVFDPVLNLNVGLDRNESHERTETGTVIAKVFYPQYEDPETMQAANPGEIILPEIAQEQTGIEKIVFNNLQENSEVRENQTIFASKEDPNGAQTDLELQVGLEQLTPWGVSYDLSLSTVRREVFYDNDGHSFDAPWASNLLLNVEVPIGNDFGEDSSAGVASRIASLEEKRQEWLLKSRINTILGQAADAYLGLVNAAELYRINLQNRDLTQEQYRATKRRFDSRNATSYELSQIEAELASARSGVETAAQNYLLSSDTLMALTSDSGGSMKSRVLVPRDYTLWLNTAMDVNPASARETAVDNRPILQAGMLEIAQSEVQQRNAALQTRPDIRLAASLGLQQNGSVYGYENIIDSLANVFDPDISTQNLAAEYRYPWGNKGLKARKRVADLQLQDSQLALELTQRQIELEVMSALNRLQTAKQVKGERERRLVLAEDAYASLNRLARNGSATQNEIVSGLRDLQNARTADLQAAIDIKSAEAALLAAQGTIDRNFASWVARNDFDTWRLAQLSKLSDFRFFVK